MTLLDRYIGIALASGFTLVMLVLVPLFSFLDFIQQLDDVGTGSYGLVDAVLFEVRMLPRRSMDLLPFGALVGSTIALVLLARRSELVAMQASGISIARIGASVLKSGAVLMLLATALEGLAVSPAHQRAVQDRSLAMSETAVQQHDEGFWIRQSGRFVNIGSLLHGHIPTDIEIFEFDDQRQLELFIYARQADISDPGHWLLRDLVMKDFRGGNLITERLPEMRWESYLTSEQVRLLELPPPAMSPTQLYKYIQYLRSSGQDADRYELALWQKLTIPLTTGAMVLLSVPFAFGSPRAISIGKRVTLAIVSGVAFQIVNQVLANAGLIVAAHPALTALLPPIVVLYLAGWLLRRARA